MDNSGSEAELLLLTVEQLVIRLQSASQPEASLYCEQLIRRFEPLLRSVWRRVPLGSEYQDFVQDVFVQLFTHLPRLKVPKAFPGYFRRIVLSVADSYIRRAKLERDSPKEAERILTGVDEEIVERLFVRTYLEHLPPREREVIELGYFADYSAEEISKVLGIEPGTVRTTKGRALRRLRKLLLDDAEALDDESGLG
ncbi:MAG: sigma-70 family RNA polymerase sigma factor [Longimicrobiaceae bacterium]